MIDDIDYLHNIQRWFCLLVHVHGDTLPQTVKLTFCSSLVGPDQTGLVQPALLPLITGEMEHVLGSSWKPIYGSSGSLETEPD